MVQIRGGCLPRSGGLVLGVVAANQQAATLQLRRNISVLDGPLFRCVGAPTGTTLCGAAWRGHPHQTARHSGIAS
jgi:hypothetical protein